VLTGLQSFLSDKAQIPKLLREARCRPAEIGGGLGIASKLADSLTSAELLAWVTVSPTSLIISIKRGRLLPRLTDTFAEPSQTNGQDNIISLQLTVPAAPAGGSGKLVFESQKSQHA